MGGGGGRGRRAEDKYLLHILRENLVLLQNLLLKRRELRGVRKRVHRRLHHGGPAPSLGFLVMSWGSVQGSDASRFNDPAISDRGWIGLGRCQPAAARVYSVSQYPHCNYGVLHGFVETGEDARTLS